MKLEKVIIHELVKEQRIQNAEVFLSDSLYTINSETIDLVERLNRSFVRDSITYAIFKNEEGDNFPQNFKSYTTSPTLNGGFVQFSRTAIMNLKQIISHVIFARGGYFVFAEYEDNNTNFISVFLIRDEKGLIFQKKEDGNGFEINSVSHLNTDKLAMGCRINLDRYREEDGKYLALIKNSNRDLSDYFSNWISTDQPESSSEYTETLYHLVSSLIPPVNPETGSEYSIDEFRKRVHDYIMNRPGKIVNISDMSHYFYQDKEHIPKFAQLNNFVIDSDFKADGRKLRKFWRLEINSDGIQLKFSRGDFNTKIRVSEENEDIIIIESSKFANKLRTEAENEL